MILDVIRSCDYRYPIILIFWRMICSKRPANELFRSWKWIRNNLTKMTLQISMSLRGRLGVTVTPNCLKNLNCLIVSTQRLKLVLCFISKLWILCFTYTFRFPKYNFYVHLLLQRCSALGHYRTSNPNRQIPSNEKLLLLIMCTHNLTYLILMTTTSDVNYVYDNL